LIMSVLISIFFLGGWFFIIPLPYWFIFSFKVVFIVFLFILIRATLPRYRYDHLMNIGWKILLPLALIYFLFICTYFFLFNVSFVI
jgi:NADH-quinone oxidoreductase subunit H